MYRLGVVLGNSLPIIIAKTEIVLCPCIALLGGFAIPICCLGIVLGYAFPFVIATSEIVLCNSIALIGEALQHWDSLVVFFVVVIFFCLLIGVLCRQREGTDDDADGKYDSFHNSMLFVSANLQLSFTLLYIFLNFCKKLHLSNNE